MRRFEAVREAWVRVRNAPDLRGLWVEAAHRLEVAIDYGFDPRELNRFAVGTHLLADQIGARERLIDLPGLPLYLSLKLMGEVLHDRDEGSRTPEVMDVLFRLDALDDKDEVTA